MTAKAVYSEIKVESALHKLKRKTPYGWDLNIYRGCGHGCRYCYAMYSHDYIDPARSFHKDIYVKTNIVDQLEKELKSESWKREVINIGGVTDSYQPAEKQFRLMPRILKLLIKYKTPAIISTKSDLVIRDYELIDELSNITYINIAATITTVDDAVRGKIEPESVSAAQRFHVLKEFRKTNASIGLHLMPIIPFITDSEDNFERMFAMASECGVHYVLPGVLYMRGKTRQHFLDFIQNEFPQIFSEFKILYKTGGANREYKNELYQMVNPLRTKYNLSGGYMKVMREKMHRN